MFYFQMDASISYIWPMSSCINCMLIFYLKNIKIFHFQMKFWITKKNTLIYILFLHVQCIWYVYFYKMQIEFDFDCDACDCPLKIIWMWCITVIYMYISITHEKYIYVHTYVWFFLIYRQINSISFLFCWGIHCCSVSMIWIWIPLREEQKIASG